jgi:hypothetical protein
VHYIVAVPLAQVARILPEVHYIVAVPLAQVARILPAKRVR